MDILERGPTFGSDSDAVDFGLLYKRKTGDGSEKKKGLQKDDKNAS